MRDNGKMSSVGSSDCEEESIFHSACLFFRLSLLISQQQSPVGASLCLCTQAGGDLGHCAVGLSWLQSSESALVGGSSCQIQNKMTLEFCLLGDGFPDGQGGPFVPAPWAAVDPPAPPSEEPPLTLVLTQQGVSSVQSPTTRPRFPL